VAATRRPGQRGRSCFLRPSAHAGQPDLAELCPPRRAGPESLLPRSKEFLEAGKKRLLGDTKREATAPEVKELCDENSRLKPALADTVLENRILKRGVLGSEIDDGTSD